MGLGLVHGYDFLRSMLVRMTMVFIIGFAIKILMD